MFHRFLCSCRPPWEPVVLGLIGMCLPLPAQSTGLSEAGVKAIVEPPVRAAMAAQGVPGMSCAIAVKGQVLYAAGYGFADLENDVPATAKTVYRLASISKPVTAVLLMQIAERGDLDLDAAVHSIVPEWPVKRWPVTSRQLLGHLGGVRHYLLEGESTRRYQDQLAGLARFAKDPLLHEPGTKFLYSTYGYNLLAAVVETHYEAPFGRVLQERLAKPCRAPSLQADDQRRLIKHRAQGYRRWGGKLGNSELMDSSYKLGGGGLCSSAPDLARFGAALLAGRLVKKETLVEMWSVQHTRAGKGTGYGLGFGVAVRDGQQLVGHSGAQSRVSTMLSMLPADEIVVVLMSNLEGTKLRPVARGIALSVREQMRGRKQ
jgi:CubicO group peptidase (beta-lactamase class C family)